MKTSKVLSLVGLAAIGGVVGWSLSQRSTSTTTSLSTTGASSSPTTAPGGAPNQDTAPSATRPSAPTTSPQAPAVALKDLGRRPDLVGISTWLQTDITSLDDLDGQVYAVQFWTFGCVNCKNVLPHLKELYAKYRDRGFEIVGVHSPEFDFERVEANVVEAVKRLEVPWPVAVDPKLDSFHAYQSPGYWPRIYLVDRTGTIRYDHIGEGAYEEIDAAVEAILNEPVQGDAQGA